MNAYDMAHQTLSCDPVNNADMLAVLTEGNAQVIHASTAGVILWFDGILFVNATSPASGLELLPLAKPMAQTHFAVVHDRSLSEAFCNAYGYRVLMHCYNQLYQQPQPPTYHLPQGAAIRPLTRSDLPAVLTHYHAINDPVYLAQRLDVGMFGVTVNGALAGFIGTHEERSIGMLEVFQPYRRMGLAYALEAYLIAHLMEQGRMAFAQVVVDNIPSLHLQKKLGLTMGTQSVSWLAPDKTH